MPIVVAALARSRNPTNGEYSWLQNEKRFSRNAAESTGYE
jgi:hypothetical protein